MKKIIITTFIGLILFACNENSDKTSQSNNNVSAVDVPDTDTMQTPGGNPPAYDPNRGSGKFTHIEVGNKLDMSLATSGEKFIL